MESWSSSPSVPHTGGTFEFPKNTGSDSITYTISYTSDTNCTATTTFVVPAGAACQCECESVSVSPTAVTFSYDSHAGDNINVSVVDSNNCGSNYSVSLDGAYASSFSASYSNGTITVTANENPFVMGDRTATINLSYDVKSFPCSVNIPIVQHGQNVSPVAQTIICNFCGAGLSVDCEDFALLITKNRLKTVGGGYDGSECSLTDNDYRVIGVDTYVYCGAPTSYETILDICNGTTPLDDYCYIENNDLDLPGECQGHYIYVLYQGTVRNVYTSLEKWINQMESHPSQQSCVVNW